MMMKKMRFSSWLLMMMIIGLLGSGRSGAATAVAAEETEFLSQELEFTVTPPAPADVIQNNLLNALNGLRGGIRGMANPIVQPSTTFPRPIQYPDGDRGQSNAEFFAEFPGLISFYDRGGTRAPYIRNNAYAWASDYNETCNLGMMIHSGGTGLYASDRDTSSSAPRITFRNENGDIVFQDYVWESLGETIDAETYPLLGTGIRTGRIVDCVSDLITIVIGVNSRLAYEERRFGDLRRMTIDFSKTGPEAVSNYAITPIRAPSVRTTFQTGCLMTFAPLFDLSPDPGLVDCTDKPTLITYDWCAATTPTEDPAPPAPEDTPCSGGTRRLFHKVFEEDPEDQQQHRQVAEELPGALIWDFECENNYDTCWISLYDHQVDESKKGGIDVFPNLYWFSKQDLAQENQSIELHRVELNMNVDTAVQSMHHIDEERVLACGLSAFAYYIEAAGTGASISIDSDVSSVELGQAQECMVCSKETNNCIATSLPGLTALTPYIWQVESCGGYMFIGTLDLNQLIDGIVYGLVTDTLEENQIELERIQIIWLIKMVEGLIFDTTVTPYDNGFDLWSIPLSDLDFPTLTSFEPVTVNGFRRADEQPVNLGPEWPFEFTPDTPQEDGIRQLMCHDDHFLMIGTTVQDWRQSSSTWVLDTNPPQGATAQPSTIRPSLWSILRGGLNAVTSNPTVLVDVVTSSFQGLVGGLEGLAGALPLPE